MLRKIENDRKYHYRELDIVMLPGVFHPKYFESSQLLLQWVEANDISGKSIIEVGCGSGITSLRAAQKGANVWAVDINPLAVSMLQQNANTNRVQLRVKESDLFSNVDESPFDFILINPPFYPKNPKTDGEKAWFCGEGFEYFHALFEQMKNRKIDTGILMTLSDDCDLEKIQTIAREHGYEFDLLQTRKSFFEKNFLFQVSQ